MQEERSALSLAAIAIGLVLAMLIATVLAPYLHHEVVMLVGLTLWLACASDPRWEEDTTAQPDVHAARARAGTKDQSVRFARTFGLGLVVVGTCGTIVESFA